MSALDRPLADYLAIRRALGYKLCRAEKLLGQFIAYLDDVGTATLSTEHALAWACLPAGGDRAWWAQRLGVVRGFAAHLKTIDPATEVPSVDLLAGSGKRRATPYLYSEEEVAALVAAAGRLASPLRRATFQTLIGLLAATGMRVGEAISLNRDDVDLDRGLIVVRGAKFGKARELPLHSSTAEALGAYLRRRERLHPGGPDEAAVLISTAGTRLIYCNVQQTFAGLVRVAGLGPRSAGCRPRLHDLRHSFAVRTVLDAYRSDGDPQRCLSLLSTYLGHVNPSNTYWYLSAAPELMELAADRLERHLGARS